MAVAEKVVEVMLQAALTDAFQKGLNQDQQLAFDQTGQSYRFMVWT